MKKPVAPKSGPKVIKRILTWILPFDERETIIGDFDELYLKIQKKHGNLTARLWSWFQILLLLPKNLGDLFFWRITMLKYYLKIAVRNTQRHKGFILLNYIGMTVGLTCFLLILFYVKFEFSYDRYHEHADSLYRIIVDTHEFYRGKDQVSITPAPLAPTLKEELPEVIGAVRIKNRTRFIRHNSELFSETVYYADPEILELFTFPLATGDKRTALNAPYSLLLTRESASKYFANRNPVGQTLSISDRQYKVTGILENIPENSHFHLDFLSPFSTLVDIIGQDRIKQWNNWSYHTYVRLGEDTDLSQLEPKLTTLLRRHHEKSDQTLRLQALKDIHFHGGTNFDLEPNADIRNVYLFSAIALFILLIACFNYMNLSTARASRRAKEVGMRKVVGATQKGLIRQFLFESFLLTLGTFLLSLGVLKLLLPAFSALMNVQLEFSLILQGGTVLMLLAVMVLVGLVSGLYPAFVLSSFRPASILKGDYKLTARGSLFLRNFLVSLQFVISIALIFCSLVVYKQLHFIKNKDLGYITDFTMSVSCFNNVDVIRQEFERYPGIVAVTTSSQSPINVTNASWGEWEGKLEDEDLIVYRLAVDYNFFDYYGIELIAGRNFSNEKSTDKETFILNEAAVKTIGWEDPLNQRFGFDKENLGSVIGVVKDFHFAPLNLNIGPLAISLAGERRDVFSLKLTPTDIPKTTAFVESTWKKYHPGRVFQYSFLDDTLDRMYRRENRLGTMFSCFTLLAILIAGLGLFGIASFTVEQRTKEVGIRKVLGASVSGITVLLIRNFLCLIVVANLIAWPVGWFIVQKWLQNFAYRTSIGPLIFAGSAFLAIGIAMLTVSFQTIRAAKADPVKSLRYE